MERNSAAFLCLFAVIQETLLEANEALNYLNALILREREANSFACHFTGFSKIQASAKLCYFTKLLKLSKGYVLSSNLSDFGSRIYNSSAGKRTETEAYFQPSRAEFVLKESDCSLTEPQQSRF